MVDPGVVCTCQKEIIGQNSDLSRGIFLDHRHNSRLGSLLKGVGGGDQPAVFKRLADKGQTEGLAGLAVAARDGERREAGDGVLTSMGTVERNQQGGLALAAQPAQLAAGDSTDFLNQG